MADLPKLLTERWKTSEGQHRLKAVVKAAQNGQDWGAILQGFPHAEQVKNGRDLRYADLTGVNLAGADLQKAILRKTILKQANLNKACLRQCDLSWANLIRADLRSADLENADLQWADLMEADLSEARLIGAELNSANLTMAKLNRANLTGADLTCAKLCWAELSEANLTAADLCSSEGTWTSLRHAVLRRANLRCADLSFANLANADLTDADFIDACMYETSIEGGRQRGARLPLPIGVSDVELVDELPVSCERSEILKPWSHTWHVAARYLEHMTRVKCPCGGVYASLKQELFFKETHEGDLAYNRVESKCQRCGQKTTLIFDVTPLMANLGYPGFKMDEIDGCEEFED